MEGEGGGGEMGEVQKKIFAERKIKGKELLNAK